MDKQKISGLMGLCVRARQAIFGEDGCMKSLRSGQCGLLLMDEAISDRVREKYLGICERCGVPYAILPEGMIFDATGRPGMAIAVLKGPLAERLSSCADARQYTSNADERRGC
ncbi:MAG: hypothetical protein MJ142_05105 [Clostridia bacterium]|nr:hypothetical protein [Clostridia bacterium]